MSSTSPNPEWNASNAKKVATSFIKEYYRQLASDATQIQSLFTPDARICFNGEILSDRQELVSRFQQMRLDLGHMELASVDAQPVDQNLLLVVVWNFLDIDSRAVHPFTETFFIKTKTRGQQFCVAATTYNFRAVDKVEQPRELAGAGMNGVPAAPPAAQEVPAQPAAPAPTPAVEREPVPELPQQQEVKEQVQAVVETEKSQPAEQAGKPERKERSAKQQKTQAPSDVKLSYAAIAKQVSAPTEQQQPQREPRATRPSGRAEAESSTTKGLPAPKPQQQQQFGIIVKNAAAVGLDEAAAKNYFSTVVNANVSEVIVPSGGKRYIFVLFNSQTDVDAVMSNPAALEYDGKTLLIDKKDEQMRGNRERESRENGRRNRAGRDSDEQQNGGRRSRQQQSQRRGARPQAA